MRARREKVSDIWENMEDEPVWMPIFFLENTQACDPQDPLAPILLEPSSNHQSVARHVHAGRQNGASSSSSSSLVEQRGQGVEYGNL